MKKAFFTQVIIAIQFAFAYIFINSFKSYDASILSVSQEEALIGYDKTFASILFILIVALVIIIIGIFIYHRRVNLIQPILVEDAETHIHNFVEGVCECGEKDPNYIPPHVHEFIEGVCECGEKDPNYVPPHVHEFIDGVCSCGEKDPNYIPPHVHKFVDGICECGEKDPNYVPEAHKVMFVDVKPEEAALKTKDMAELITESISVEEAKEKIEDEVLENLVVKANDLAKYRKAKKERYIVNIDVISEKFQNGEVVNLESLKARNLLPKKCNYFKVLARGILDKQLTFEANDFSKDAIKMILLTGGNVIKVQ